MWGLLDPTHCSRGKLDDKPDCTAIPDSKIRCQHLDFKYKEIEAQRSTLPCSGPHSCKAAEPGLEPDLAPNLRLPFAYHIGFLRLQSVTTSVFPGGAMFTGPAGQRCWTPASGQRSHPPPPPVLPLFFLTSFFFNYFSSMLL